MQAQRRRKVLMLVALALAPVTLTGCFSFDKGGMIHVEGYLDGVLPASRVTIYRRATRALTTVYRAAKGTNYQKTAAVATILRTGAGQLSDFWADRWNAATAPDQYQELKDALALAGVNSYCLVMKGKVGPALDIGYKWYTRPVGDGVCTWGADPFKA